MPAVNKNPEAFRRAAGHIMPFGRYQGQTFDTVAMTDEGLRYLDWMRGAVDARQRPALAVALRNYLDDPTIAAEVDRATGR